MNLIRLNKFLAHSGVASRREADLFISRGLIKVNGTVIDILGSKIDIDKDVIEIDGIVHDIKDEKIVIALNKPVGYVTTCKRNEIENKIVMDLVDIEERVYPVGRLDRDSEGLLILTNDGLLTYKLTHPSFEHEKEYLVEVDKYITDGALNKLRSGLKILGEKTKEVIIKRVNEKSFYITLKEGKNRHIRRICKKVGYIVKKLKRVRIGDYKLGNLVTGQYQYLSKDDIKILSKT